MEASSKLPAGLEERYEYLDTLGGGGMGLVFLVKHRVLHSPCVLKILRPELAQQRDFVDRFAKREVLLMAKAGAHPNIVEALDAGWSNDGAPFLLMQFVEGPSLAALIRDRGPLNLNDALRHFEQIVALLEHLYHMLAGIQPLEDIPYEDWLDSDGRKREPTPIEERRGDVPPRVAALLRKAMDPDPARRFSTPMDLRTALHGILVKR